MKRIQPVTDKLFDPRSPWHSTDALLTIRDPETVRECPLCEIGKVVSDECACTLTRIDPSVDERDRVV